jgi:hypothetical protein
MANGELGADDGGGLPKHTTPTWEVELLISGVAVFAMLQLPGLLDDAILAMLPRFGPGWAQPLEVMYMYLKTAAVILAATFSIHLLLRAHWIALVGLHSVFPDGIRGERLRMGPLQRAADERHAPGRDQLIDQADNRATVVFAIGVMMATMLLTVSLLVALVFGLLSLLLLATGVPADNALVFAASAMLVVVPFAVASFVDRRWGARLAPDGFAARALSRMFQCYRTLGFGRGNNAMALLASHGGQRRTMLLVMAVFFPIMFSVVVGLKALQHPERFGNYGRFPGAAAGPGGNVDPAHYDAMRAPSRDPAVPFIQDAVVAGPYVRLVVPFLPGRDDVAMRAACPGAGVDDSAAMACLQRLHALALDGKPLQGQRYDAGNDPRTDRPALVAMIDVRALPPGRHELRVARTDASAGERAAGETDYVIPFWR